MSLRYNVNVDLNDFSPGWHDVWKWKPSVMSATLH